MIDNTPEGIMHMHKQMLMWRNQAMGARQFEIAEIMTVIAAHLADYAAIVKLMQTAKDEWKRMQLRAKKERDKVDMTKMQGHGMPDQIFLDEVDPEFWEKHQPYCVPPEEFIKRWTEEGQEGEENKAQWSRSDGSGQTVRITATWKDNEDGEGK